MPKTTRVLVMGLGHVGCAVARTVLGEPGLRLAGAVDAAPHLAGRPLREVIDDPRAGRQRVRPSLDRAPSGDVVVIATSSRVREVAPEALRAVRRGLHVVTSCEELAHPWSADAAAARRLDRAARTAGVTILATGVNPGFALDRFVLTVASATLGVERVCAERVVDLATRRPALRAKAGVGQSLEAFRHALGQGRIGHVGLEASARLVAEGLGWEPGRYVESVEPILATSRLRGPGYDVAPGAVAGVRHQGILLEGRTARVLLRLDLAVEARAPRDAVLVEARVPLRAMIPGGLPGEPTTIAALIRGITAVRHASPGLLTPVDLPAAPVPRPRG